MYITHNSDILNIANQNFSIERLVKNQWEASAWSAECLLVRDKSVTASFLLLMSLSLKPCHTIVAKLPVWWL